MALDSLLKHSLNTRSRLCYDIGALPWCLIIIFEERFSRPVSYSCAQCSLHFNDRKLFGLGRLGSCFIVASFNCLSISYLNKSFLPPIIRCACSQRLCIIHSCHLLLLLIEVVQNCLRCSRIQLEAHSTYQLVISFAGLENARNIGMRDESYPAEAARISCLLALVNIDATAEKNKVNETRRLKVSGLYVIEFWIASLHKRYTGSMSSTRMHVVMISVASLEIRFLE